ncbi:UNVERIFIED_CONTAM: methyltransferase family protein [Acetivibrio alkalicellulosi]
MGDIMGFYDEISKYYDYIFPVQKEQLKFLMDSLGDTKKEVLDVACGSGGYSIELAKKGYEVTAVDVENEMIDKLKSKAQKEQVDINSYVCDMKNIKSMLPNKYNLVFCIGNSIVHLKSLDEIKDVLKQMKKLLRENGAVVLQIINYDRIIDLGLTELPKIQNESIGLEFKREYEFLKDKNIVNFKTTLSVNNEVFNNSIELLPIKSVEFKALLKEAGYSSYELYGDFNYSTYDKNSYMLVIKAF